MPNSSIRRRRWPRRRKAACLAALGLVLVPVVVGTALAARGDIATITGNGTYGYSGDGGAATSAAMRYPMGVHMDKDGNFFVADFYNHAVRKVTASGTITTVAGTGTAGYSGDGGAATSAQLSEPADVALDGAGNLIIADSANKRVRKVDTSGVISTVAGTGVGGYSGDGGPATSAKLGWPEGVAFDPYGNLLIADPGNHTVRKVDTSGTITTAAGTGRFGFSGDGGPATSAKLDGPDDVAADAGGNLFIADRFNHRIRKVDTTGVINTVAGTGGSGSTGDGGAATSAEVGYPQGIAVDRAGNLFVSQELNHRVRKVNTSAVISTVAGTGTEGFSGDGGPATSAQLNHPARVNLGPGGDLYIPDRANNRVRRVEALASPDAPTVTATSPASPANDNAPEVKGSARSDTTVKLYTNSTCTSAQAASGTAGTFAGAGLTVSVADNSTTTFYATATDADGSVSPCSTTSVTYVEDSQAPATPSITSSPGASGSDKTPTWGFSGDADATFECELRRGTTVVSAYAACTSPKTYDISAEPDGTYTFSVRAKDATGNLSTAATSDYTLDSTAPAAPTITARPTSPGKGRTPAWEFTADPGATFECKLTRGTTVVSDLAPCASPKSYDLSGQPDGTYTFHVRAVTCSDKDCLLLKYSAFTAEEYTLDTTAPAAPDITSTPGALGSSRTPSWGFSAESGATVECRLARASTVLSDFAACTSPKSYDLTGEPDGIYVFSVRAKDAAGNVGPAASHDYTLDTAAPAAPDISSTPGAIGSSTSPSWGFSAETGATLECRLSRGSTVVFEVSTCTSPKSYDLSGEPDGAYAVGVRATDEAGNVGAWATDTYTLDTAAEAPRLVSAPGALGRDATPAWEFAAEPGASFRCELVQGSTVISELAACSSPRSYDLTGQPDGTYTFRVQATDSAGNLSALTTDPYTLDTTAGTPTIGSAPGAVGRDPTPEWAFAGEAGASFECKVTRGERVVSHFSPCTSPRRYDLAGEPDGSYTFSVRLLDALGNLSGVATDAYELDRAARAPRITSSPGPSGADASPAWSFSGEPGASFECRLERGSTLVARFSHCASPRRYDLSDEPDGTYTLGVRATDPAGNVSRVTSDDYALERGPDAGAETPGPGTGSAGPSPGPGATADPPPEPQSEDAVEDGATASRSRPRAARAGARARRAEPPPPRASAAPPRRRVRAHRSLKARVARALRGLARGARVVAEKSAFPMGLLFLVVGFLGAQDRIDRRDPKLALAPVFADPDLEFPPPWPGAGGSG